MAFCKNSGYIQSKTIALIMEEYITIFKSKRNSLKSFVDQHDGLQILDEYIQCLRCQISIKRRGDDNPKNIVAHMATEQHQDSVRRFRYIQNLDASPDNIVRIHNNLLKLFLKLDIPLKKLGSVYIKEFFLENFAFLVKSESYFYKNVSKIEKLQDDMIIDYFANNPFSLHFDESTDAKKRRILNIVAENLKSPHNEPILVHSYEIPDLKADTLTSYINECLMKYFSVHKDNYANFRVIVSDGAANCLKTIENLKSQYPGLQSSTCLAHNINLLCSFISDKYPLADLFATDFAKIFKNNTKMKQLWKTETNLPLPKFVIKIRWGSLINFSLFLIREQEQISVFIEKLGNDHNQLKGNFRKRLTLIHFEKIANYEFLIQYTRLLEQKETFFIDQADYISEIFEIIENADVKNRFFQTINKNIVFDRLYDLFIKDYPDCIQKLNCTTVNCERSFNNMKLILSYLRRTMSMETFNVYMRALFNKSL